MNDQKILWIFDLDDTLFWNERSYSNAFLAFYHYLSKEVFPHRSLPFIGMLARQSEEFSHVLTTEINPATNKPYGVSGIDRYPQALVRCYKWLCDSRPNMHYDAMVAYRIFEIGRSTFSEQSIKEIGLAPYAEAVLKCFQEQGDALVLLTRGNPNEQRIKIKVFGLERWFGQRGVYIVEKKEATLFAIIDGCFPECIAAASVGNSYKNDIKPALEAELFAVYIPGETWKGEEREGPIAESDKLFVVDALKDVIGVRERILLQADHTKKSPS